MHVALPLSHECIVLQCWTEWKRQEIFAELSRRKFNGKIILCSFCACFYSLKFFSLIWNELKKFRSQSVHDSKKTKLKRSDHSEFKNLFTRERQLWFWNSVFPLNTTCKYEHCSRKYLPYDNTMKCESLLNSRIQCDLLPGLF